jgi:cytochrome c oxidase subunit IV
MATHLLSVKTYFSVVSALILLTVVTTAISFFELPGSTHVIAGLSIAVVKASLVIVFFMHALHSPRLTWCVILACIVFLIILFSLTLADVLTRSLVPFTPGH